MTILFADFDGYAVSMIQIKIQKNGNWDERSDWYLQGVDTPW